MGPRFRGDDDGYTSRPLKKQAQFEFAEAEVVPSNPLMQFGGGVLLVPQVVGEREGEPVDIGLEKRRQRGNAQDFSRRESLRQAGADQDLGERTQAPRLEPPVAELLEGSGGMPQETRNYVVAITGSTIDDWAAASKSSKPAERAPTTSSLGCRELMALLRAE